MAKGRIKRFSEQKGFGFIEVKDGKDVFVHRTAIQGEGFTLREGDQVEFEISQGPKGPRWLVKEQRDRRLPTSVSSVEPWLNALGYILPGPGQACYPLPPQVEMSLLRGII